MKFETISPNGVSITLGSSQDGDTNKVASPKALMLSSLAVCSGLDVVSILDREKGPGPKTLCHSMSFARP